jgi:uncharacterized Zn finger protein
MSPPIARRTRRSGQTWWGRAWVEAMEQRARLDPNRLPRGRSYARQGAVGELTFKAGEVRAPVQGRRRSPYNARVRVVRFTEQEWDQVLAAISAQLGHTAAMLDGELPPEAAADVTGAGLDLLPGPGDLGLSCSCPDDADPCKHAAALCYLIADGLDADPFLLFLLRGRSRTEVLDGLRDRRRAAMSGRAGRPSSAVPTAFWPEDDAGVDAREALAGQPADGVPLAPTPPARPGYPPRSVADPGAPHADLRDDVASLAADAALRAWRLAVGLDQTTGLELDAEADLARRAEAAFGTAQFDLLAARCGVPGRDLARQALAWRFGGADGLAVLQTDWDPSDEVAGVDHLLDAARAQVRLLTGVPPRRTRSRLTSAGIQLRLGRNLLWYPYLRSSGQWDPAGPPSNDPGVALQSC